MNKWDEAEEPEVRVKEALRRVLGAEHPFTLTSMVNPAFTRKDMARDAKTMELMKEYVAFRDVLLS